MVKKHPLSKHKTVFYLAESIAERATYWVYYLQYNIRSATYGDNVHTVRAVHHWCSFDVSFFRRIVILFVVSTPIFPVTSS